MVWVLVRLLIIVLGNRVSERKNPVFLFTSPLIPTLPRPHPTLDMRTFFPY